MHALFGLISGLFVSLHGFWFAYWVINNIGTNIGTLVPMVSVTRWMAKPIVGYMLVHCPFLTVLAEFLICFAGRFGLVLG
jgi:hypothetical protein